MECLPKYLSFALFTAHCTSFFPSNSIMQNLNVWPKLQYFSDSPPLNPKCVLAIKRPKPGFGKTHINMYIK